MELNEAGLDLIKSFEGCKLEVYQDLVGIPTVGYGHVTDLPVGSEITQEEADRLLEEDLERFCTGVEALVQTEINDNQFSALVSLAYNIGLSNFRSSLLLRCINKNNMDDASKQFERWCHAGGRTVAGLLRRRLAERDLFLS